MDCETFIHAIDLGPVRVHLKDGNSFVIDNPEWCGVDSTTAYVMYRDQESSKIKTHWLALVCMTRIEQLESAA